MRRIRTDLREQAERIVGAIGRSATLRADAIPEDLGPTLSYWPQWQPDTRYAKDQILGLDGMLYRVLQEHTSQAHQPPGSVGMLAVYAPVQMQPEDDKVLPWVSGETGIAVGDKREYKGVVYEAIQLPGANIYAPDLVPAIWRRVV